MAYPTHPLEELLQSVRSAQADVRSVAFQELLGWVEKDPWCHSTVLPIFREALKAEDAPWGVVSAAQALDLLVGGEEARNAWLGALTHRLPEVAALAVSFVRDPSYAPVLLDLMARRPEPEVRVAAICALGRIQCVEALPVLVSHLAPLESRWEAIEALSNLGDPRAIPYLEPYLEDQSGMNRPDDRGWPIDVPHIAGQAIRRLEHLAKMPLKKRPAVPIPGTPLVRSPGLPPPPLPGRNRTPHNPWAYLPLVAALVEFPWLVIVATQVSLPVKEATRAANTARNHQLDVLASLPVAAGLLIGLLILLRGTARRPPERACIYLGAAICGVFLYFLGREFFN